MGDVIELATHARTSTGSVSPKTAGAASLPRARKTSENTRKCSVGIRSRAIQLKGALCDLTPAIAQAAEGPPTASITSLTVKSMLTRSDNSRSVILSSPHNLGVPSFTKTGSIIDPMYSKKATAKRVKDTQEALGMTNEAIADALGIKSNRWSQYRTGDRTLPLNVLVSLKERFGVTSDWLLAGDPSSLPQAIYAKLRAKISA